MPNVKVLEQFCKGCGLCVPVCPKDILYLADTVNRRGARAVRVREDIPCTGCGQCAAMCPDAALEVLAEAPQT